MLLQSFRKVIGEGSIGRVHLGRWQETDVAIKLLSIGGALQPVPSGQGQVASFEEDDTELDDEGSDQDLVNDELAVTVRTLEREVSPHTTHQPYINLTSTLHQIKSMCLAIMCSSDSPRS